MSSCVEERIQDYMCDLSDSTYDFIKVECPDKSWNEPSFFVGKDIYTELKEGPMKYMRLP